MALGPETIREIERQETLRSVTIWANNENRRREQDAKEKKRPFTDADKVSIEQRVALPKFRPNFCGAGHLCTLNLLYRFWSECH